MKSDDFVEEFRAHEERVKRRRGVAIVIGVVSLALLVSILGTLAVGAALQNRGFESASKASFVEQQEYPHIELGERCDEAIVAYDERIKVAQQELEAYVTEAEARIAALQLENQEYQRHLTNAIGPGVNYDALGDLGREARETFYRGINEINQSIIDVTEQTNDIVKEYTEKRNQLVTCYNLVNERKEIPEYKVMEYDVLIREVV